MKTTIEINDNLLRQAKQFAQERNISLRAVLEGALRQFLEASNPQARPPFKLRKHVVHGRGLQPGLKWDDWEQIRSLIYEGRGG
jgi:hypothetical protein